MSLATNAGSPFGAGLLHPPNSLVDTTLATTVARYKRIVARRYRGLRDGEFDELPVAGPVHVSPKIDGQCWFLWASPEGPVA